jgi:hypothetical protein
MRRTLVLAGPVVAAVVAAAVAMRSGVRPVGEERPGPRAAVGTSSAAADPIARLSTSLKTIAMLKEPCESALGIVEEADAYLDVHEGSAPGYALLGNALSLADETCTSTVAARHAKASDEARAAAKSLDPALAIGAPPTWAGSVYAREGRGRCARARVAIDRGDGFEARRELRWVDYLSIDMGMPLCEPDEVEALWRDVKRLPLRPAAHAAKTPEDAIGTLERAAIAGDLALFRSMLSKAFFEREQSEGVCGPYTDDKDTLMMCILNDIVGEEPVVAECTSEGPGTSRCTSGHRSIALEQRAGSYAIVSSDPDDSRRP